jgi:hypothetical protein
MANDSRPPMNVYTAMLVLSFIALAIGCIFLALNLNLYEFKIMPDVGRPYQPVGPVFHRSRPWVGRQVSRDSR